MTALMSIKAGVFPGAAGSHTEVPAQPGVTHVELAAPAFGDAPFTVVSSG